MRIKEILKEKGLSQKEFASRLGMSEVGFSIAISEKGNPPINKIKEIAAALGVPITDLFEPPASDAIICPKCGARLEIKVKE
ncbi:MAG: helix-turn-helix transcriptional regulator [Tannerella sp.]|jgi:transcriptional regulator with XRE-family HTH domain|nr:helix-turn-helix transcriptional regulator [Tannerella sp.]